MANPPSGQLPVAEFQVADTDPPIDKIPPSLDRVRDPVAKLRRGNAPGICIISPELLKAGGKAMVRGLHAVMIDVWQYGIILSDWKRGLIAPTERVKGTTKTGITLLTQPSNVFAHLLLMLTRNQLLKQ